MSKEAMKLALEVMQNQGDVSVDEWIAAEKALREALAEQPATIETNGGKTGWPPGLLQDDCKGLSKWLSNRPDAKRRVREALAEQPAQQVVDCHATGVCVQSGLRAEQPAQQELTNIERHERNVQTFLGEQPAPVAKPHEQEPFGFAVMENPIAPPAQRTWVGLTDEERDTLIKEFNGLAVSFYKAIEAKLRSKNEDRN